MEPEDINPYAALHSRVIAHASEDFSAVPSAEGGKRFLNLLIDRMADLGVEFCLGMLLALMDRWGVTTHAVDMLGNLGTVGFIFFGCGVSVTYYTLCEGLCGRTLGKWITGTKAVMASGTPLTWNAALVRSLVRLVPFEALSFLGSTASGWHDRWTDTRVIDLRAAPVPKARPMTEANLPRFYTPQLPGPGIGKPGPG